MTHHRKALELLRGGDWDAAHELVQPHEDRLSCLIHALLHRQEGDDANAAYWYRQAHEAYPDNDIGEEIDRLSAMVPDQP